MFTKIAVAALIVSSFAIAGCQDEHADHARALSSQVDQAASRLGAARALLAAREEHMAQTRAELGDLRSRRDAIQVHVAAVMVEHKMAVAAIALGLAGGRTAFDADNQFTDEVRAVGGIVGIVAAGYALFNMEEVAAVVDDLTQSDARMKSLDSAERRLTDSFAVDERALPLEQAQCDTLARQLGDVRNQLASL